MGQEMKLIEVIKNIDSYDVDMTIYAAKPWSSDSEVVVDFEPEEGGLPESLPANVDYFLEVFIAKDFISDWISMMSSKPSLDAICDRLIEYAINDS